jgi:hypothetical protein
MDKVQKHNSFKALFFMGLTVTSKIFLDMLENLLPQVEGNNDVHFDGALLYYAEIVLE